MALESVFAIAPPLVGEKNKDTKNDDMESMENEGSDDGLEDEDLEEGEILDSGGEGESEEKTGNAQQTNGISGVQQSALGGPMKRKNADIGDQDGGDGTELHQKKKALYIDHDEVLDEDEWDRSVTFNVKRSQYQDSLEDFKRKMAAYKRKESQFSNSDGSANEDSLPGDRRSASPSSVKAKRKSKLVSMCRLKGKKSGAKSGKKRKLDSKSKSLRQKRELRHNRPTCKFFLDGKCAKGSDCPFYHPPPHPRKKELCKFYSSGHCAKGKHCYFMHEEFPCKFYHTGAICYSKESCRFSHKPLTEETRRLLDKHLGSFNRGDDDDDDDVDEDYYRERSRRPGKPESKAKRPCLLGSPPRHIREAAETKQWQEEMKKLQHESKVSAFEIQVGPTKEVPPPNKFSRPNYYSDTLPCSSPRRRTPSGEVSDSVSSSKSYEVLNQPKFASLIAEESDKDWTSICDMVNKLSPSVNDSAEKVGSADQEYFEMNPEEKNHPEVSEDMEPLAEPEKAPSPTRGHQEIHNSEFVESPKQDNERAESPEERTPVHVSESYPHPEVTLPPINIPSHLPRKQRELFMRIQHNQKRIPSEESAATNATPDTPEKMEVVKAEGEINEPIIKKDDDFYSSEEDDDIDQPLTNVLKKLHETPCPKDKDASPATTTPAPIDIVQMIKSITEKASEKPQSSAYHETEAFWQNILSSSAPLSAPSVVTTLASQSPSTIETPQSPKDSENAEISRDPRKGAQEPKPSIPRDPRLQNREQRKPSRDFPSFPSPPLSIEDSTNTFMPLVDPKIGSQLPNKLRDISTMLQNPTPAVVVEGLQGLGSFPYKLHEVSASPPNYLSYIYASNYDTKLLSDPRLRKHIAQGSNTVQQLALQSRGITLPNIPLLPLNSLNSDIGSPVPNEDNLGEKNSSAPEGLKSEEVKIPLQKVVDPRVRKTDAIVDPRRAVHTPVSETVPTRSHPVVPSPASHLPRAIADPRLAKLHHPLDPRRPRSIAERNSQRMSERKVAAALPPKNVPSASAEEKNSPAKSATENVAPCESVSKVELEDKNKRDVQENGSKKSDASKNRKSSMSYASPLNSCEDSVSSSAPGYNSYNQRPKRRMPNVPPVAESCVPVNDSASKSPDFSVCDSSLLGNEDPENSTSLKDMFKTIDPAASPFC